MRKEYLKMKLVWLLLAVCLSVTSSFVLNNIDTRVQDAAELDALENEMTGLLSGLLAGTIQ